MMTFLERFEIYERKVEFWSGFDLEQILNHPKNGSQGYIIVLVESIENENLKYKRELKINKIFSNSNQMDFYKILENLKNNYVIIYQSNGQDEQNLIDIVKEKFSKSQIW